LGLIIILIGPDLYGEIVTTRSYADRLDTLATVRALGIDLCCGGIIGMGETVRDRAAMVQILAGMSPHPESVPINAVVPVKGSPLANGPGSIHWSSFAGWRQRVS
jgi:biotin synthase